MKTTPRIMILIGAPGSGKTTFAESFVTTHRNWIRVSRDDLRAMNFNTTILEQRAERMTSVLVDAAIDCLLRQGCNVLLDATHCRRRYLTQHIRKFNHRATITFKLFELETDELIARCMKREAKTGRKVPADVVRRFVDELEQLKRTFDFSPRPRILPPAKK